MGQHMVNKRQLVVTDADNAATVLAQAFASDPLWCYLLPDARQRAHVIRQSFRAVMPWYLQHYLVYGVGEPLVGVAMWSSPQPRPNPWWALFNLNSLTLLVSPLLGALRRAVPIFTQFERMHQQYVTQPHYYLSTIGIVPEAQGRGYASQLLRPVLEQADAQGLGTYTETMTPSNVPLYEHYGFICREQYHVPSTNLSIWALYRPGSPIQ